MCVCPVVARRHTSICSVCVQATNVTHHWRWKFGKFSLFFPLRFYFTLDKDVENFRKPIFHLRRRSSHVLFAGFVPPVAPPKPVNDKHFHLYFANFIRRDCVMTEKGAHKLSPGSPRLTRTNFRRNQTLFAIAQLDDISSHSKPETAWFSHHFANHILICQNIWTSRKMFVPFVVLFVAICASVFAFDAMARGLFHSNSCKTNQIINHRQ